MKQKDGDKVKPSTSHSSGKGRRKLEFEKKSKQLPLSGKIIYLDVKDVRQAKNLEGKLKQLGGAIEKFLIKDVNYVISSNAPTSGQKKVDKGQGRAESPAFQSTPSPFNMGQSPSPGAVESKKETVTRGKAILQIAKNKSSHTNVIDTAEKMGIKIVALDAAIKWIEKEMLKIKPSAVLPSTKQASKKRSGLKVQKLKTPYVKFEAKNCHYRPIMSQLDTWPRVNIETLPGTCPFDGRALGKPQNSERGDREEGLGAGNILSPGTPQAQRDELSGTPQAKSQSKTTKIEENSTCRLFGVPIVTAGEIKREKDRRKRECKRKGYCECCKEKYDNVDKHLRGEEHKTFVRNKKNFDALDRLINQGPNTVIFLQSILFKHCVQKAANKTSSQQAEEDVLLIEERGQKSTKTSSPDLPPEQLRVERKLNRKHRSDKHHEKSRELVIKLERANLGENQDRGRKFDTGFRNKNEGKTLGYSSPSKQRSGSFPCIDKETPQSTAAVVIRRSGSRGVYGSPRRSHSSSVRSEKTLVIRDSPIASLQPLKDFLNKHSTRAEIDDKTKSSSSRDGLEFKKRKSDSSSSQSPCKKKHQKRSHEVQADVTVHSQYKSDCDRQNTKYKKMKTSADFESHVQERLVTERNCQRHNDNTTVDESLKLTPSKKSCRDLDKVPRDSFSPRKSLRLSSHCAESKVCSTDTIGSSPELMDTSLESGGSVSGKGSGSRRVKESSSHVHENKRTKYQNAGISEKSKSDKHSKMVHANFDPEKIEMCTITEHEDIKCVGSPRSRSKHRKHCDSRTTHSNASKLTKEECEFEQSDQLSAVSARLRSSPRKMPKLSKECEISESDSRKGNSVSHDQKEQHVSLASDGTETVKKRKKWKKSVQPSPSKKRSKKLSKLKLDESFCSDLSTVSELSPPKLTITLEDVTLSKHYIRVSDSSSPTFKKHSKKVEKGEARCNRPTSELHTDVTLSPVFKRRSRPSDSDMQENSVMDLGEDGSQFRDRHGSSVKELLEKTPKRGKSRKASRDNEDREFESPKSGYSRTPRRQKRSRRSIASELLDQTLCDDELEADLQLMPDCEEARLESLSPVRSKRKSQSSSHEGDCCGTPVKLRATKGRQSGIQKEKEFEEKIENINLEVSPSRKKSTGCKVVEEKANEHTNKRQKISPENKKTSDSNIIKSPIKDNSTFNLRKSPRKIPLMDGEIPVTLKSSSVSSRTDSLNFSPKKASSKGKRKWRRCNTPTRAPTRTVKLNRSWLVLSERSMSKLLESEGDQEPFLGFNKEDSDTRLPSDLTYEEVSEVDMSEDSTREWVIEEQGLSDEDENLEELDETLMEETSMVAQFLPSPDKASNSSWGDACDSFLQSACEKGLKGKICSTPLLLKTNKDLPPSKKFRGKKPYSSPEKRMRQQDGDKGTVSRLAESDTYCTPKKARKVSPKDVDDNSEVLVDKEIVFNFNYRSPKKTSGGSKDAKKLCKGSDQRLTEEQRNSDRKSDKPLRLLKKASDTKKTFKLSYVSKPAKSPKPKQKINIDSGRTIVIVSPKSRHK